MIVANAQEKLADAYTWNRYRKTIDEPIVVQNLDLRNHNFAGYNLTGVGFEGCNLSGASFDLALLRSTGFIGCNLTGANISEVSLRDCFFIRCLMREANMTNTCAVRTAFERCNLRHAALDMASFRGAIFYLTDLSHATLTATELARSIISHCVAVSTFGKPEVSECHVIGTPIQGRLREAFPEETFFSISPTGFEMMPQLHKEGVPCADNWLAEGATGNMVDTSPDMGPSL